MGSLERRDFGYFDSWYASDFPFRSFFPNWEHGGSPEFALRNSRAALEYSTSDFAPARDLGWLLESGPRTALKYKTGDTFLALIRDRFAGCPERDVFLAERSLSRGETEAAAAHYREGIKDAPNDWRSYGALGELLFRLGESEKSAQVFMSYPGFAKDSRENSVTISNHAYEAGSFFYWGGEFKLAEPLYRIAAGLDTGSEASITSRIRLNMLKGNYSAAQADSLNRARRYNSPYGFRDYLGMLYAMGRSKEAWSAFNLLVPRLRASQLWETALVGQRIERKSESQVVAWLRQSGFRDIGDARDDVALYLVRAGTTDRMPSDALAQSVAEFAWPVVYLSQGDGLVVRVPRSGAGEVMLNSPAHLPGAPAPGAAARQQVKSDLVYFVEAYRALRLGDAAGAQVILKQAQGIYGLHHSQLTYLLPYYAFAAAKAGNAATVAALLDRIGPERRGFDYYLAEAAITGLGGRTEESMRSLKSALSRRIYTEERPVYAEYQFAEMGEWLYRATGKPEYRSLILDWVTKVEKFAPWYAWPYAMQAELETDPARRQRALAMAAYLDPDSERLAAFSKNVVKRAVRKFGRLNPFLAKPGKKSGAGAI
jgi:tetratricopeptide (TPR) repeat protein